MPLLSRTQGRAAQVTRLSYFVPVGMATAFLIVSFIFFKLQFSFERWPVKAPRCLHLNGGECPQAPVDISSHQAATYLLPSKHERLLEAGGELLKIQEHAVGGKEGGI